MILVTGATGHVGSELVAQLVERGERVRAMPRRPEAGGFMANALQWAPMIRAHDSLPSARDRGRLRDRPGPPQRRQPAPASVGHIDQARVAVLEDLAGLALGSPAASAAVGPEAGGGGRQIIPHFSGEDGSG